MTDASPPAGEIRLELAPPLAWLIVDNPARRNAVSKAMWQAIPERLDEVAANPEIRVLILRGAGEKTFVSGADISEFETTRRDARTAADYEQRNASAFADLRNLAIPTIAMIRGFCLGGGMGLAAACDLRVAARGSVFGIPAARLGVGYPPDAYRDVVRLVGASAAKRLFFTADRIDAEAALALGLIDLMIEEEDLETYTQSLAATIADNAPLTIRAAKKAIDLITGDPAEADWQALQEMTDRCFDSADFAEGRTAFLEKRRPKFVGK